MKVTWIVWFPAACVNTQAVHGIPSGRWHYGKYSNYRCAGIYTRGDWIFGANQNTLASFARDLARMETVANSPALAWGSWPSYNFKKTLYFQQTLNIISFKPLAWLLRPSHSQQYQRKTSVITSGITFTLLRRETSWWIWWILNMWLGQLQSCQDSVTRQLLSTTTSKIRQWKEDHLG